MDDNHQLPSQTRTPHTFYVQTALGGMRGVVAAMGASNLHGQPEEIIKTVVSQRFIWPGIVS